MQYKEGLVQYSVRKIMQCLEERFIQSETLLTLDVFNMCIRLSVKYRKLTPFATYCPKVQ